MPVKSIAKKIVSRTKNDFNLNSAKSHCFFKSEWELHHDNNENPDIETGVNSTTLKDPEVSLKYLIYRGIYMLILLSCITASTLCQSYLFPIFLTNWSFTLQNLYAVLFFTSVFWRWITMKKKNNFRNSRLSVYEKEKSCEGNLSLNDEDKKGDVKEITKDNNKGQFILHDIGKPHSSGQEEDNEEECEQIKTTSISSFTSELSILEKAIWILMNIVHVLPYCVVLGYWGFVYKLDPDQPACEKFKSHYIVHGLTAILALFDTLVIAVPARFTHFLIPTTLLLVYVIFTGLYELGGGPYRDGKEHIYSILDWKNKPKKALIFGIVGVIVSPFAHVIFCWGLHKLRLVLVSLYKKCCVNKN